MSLLDIREMLKMAVKDEETGIAFYAALAETTYHENAKATLKKMSEQEKVHKDRYEEILNNLGDYKPNYESFKGEYEGYMDALLTQRAFDTPEAAVQKAKETTNIVEAIDTAINMERDTILFYFEIKELVETDKKHIIQDIIDEEKIHVYELTDLKKSL